MKKTFHSMFNFCFGKYSFSLDTCFHTPCIFDFSYLHCCCFLFLSGTISSSAPWCIYLSSMIHMCIGMSMYVCMYIGVAWLCVCVCVGEYICIGMCGHRQVYHIFKYFSFEMSIERVCWFFFRSKGPIYSRKQWGDCWVAAQGNGDCFAKLGWLVQSTVAE